MSPTTTSCSLWASIKSAMSLWSSPQEQQPPPLQEVLLANNASSPRRQESIQQLWERADALQRQLQAATDQMEAAEVATRHAERRAGEAATELQAVTRTCWEHQEKLRELAAELRDRDARVKVLEAIAATLTNKK